MDILVGGYTERLPDADGRAAGITVCRFDDAEIGTPRHAAALRNPSWLIVSAGGDAVYAVEENAGDTPGGLVSLTRNTMSGQLSEINRRPSDGSAPAHLAIDPTTNWLVTANYGSGTLAVHNIRPDCGIGDVSSIVQRVGSGPNGKRQDASHPHQVVFDPVTGFILVPDLGTDSISTYTLRNGILNENEDDQIPLEPGTGPRHIALHPDGKHLFVIGELSATVDVFRRHDGGSALTGHFNWKQRISLLRYTNETAAAAEILVSADGTAVFASNRGTNPTVTVFSFDPHQSILTQSTWASAPQTPRAMCLVANSRYLLVAGQDANEVAVYAIDTSANRLSHVRSIAVATPTCMVPLPRTG